MTNQNTLLASLPRFAGTAGDGFKPGLDRMHRLLDAMGQPHEAFPSIHVAGTNGKGSTASMTASILAAAGGTVGLHTTPSIHDVTERMRVNGVPAPSEWLDDALSTHANLFARVEPTFFEATVALSFLYFADVGVDVGVIEVGLGGRLDATNVLHPAVCVVTSIDLEHTDLLGDTLDAIAREKAGIFASGVPAVTGVTQPEALAGLRAVAEETGAPLYLLSDDTRWHVRDADLTGTTLDVTTPVQTYEGVRVALPGRHQQTNAVLAIRAVEGADEEVGLGVGADAVRTGLAEVQARTGLRGRLEVLSETPRVLLDVAHNPSSLAATLSVVVPHVTGELVVGLGVAADKDWQTLADLLAAHASRVVPLKIDVDRALSPRTLAGVLRDRGLRVDPPASVPDALAAFQSTASPDDTLLLTGSHTVAAAVGRMGDG